MAPREAEIGIVGAGPAGARAAELLAKAGAEVVLLDPEAPWEKPCGGGITAGTFREVPELRELLPAARRVDEVRLEASGHALRVRLDAPLAVLPRIELARWQLERATVAGAEAISRRVRGIGRVNGEWWLRLGEGDDEVRVRRLVGADGAASRVRRTVRPGFRPVLAPTRVAYPELDERAMDAALFRFEPGLDGYVWDFPRADHRSVGAGVSGSAASREGLDRAVESYWRGATGGELHGVPRTGAVIGTAGREHSYIDVGDADWALLGDAAGFADPVTGEGIRNAFRSAACLADAYRADGTFAGYPARAEATFERGFRLARRIHTLLYQGRAAGWIVEAGTRSPAVEALVAAVSNGGNEHELRGTMLGRWRAAYREARAA